MCVFEQPGSDPAGFSRKKKTASLNCLHGTSETSQFVEKMFSGASGLDLY